MPAPYPKLGDTVFVLHHLTKEVIVGTFTSEQECATCDFGTVTKDDGTKYTGSLWKIRPIDELELPTTLEGHEVD